MEEFDNRLQHSALIVAATVGAFSRCFTESRWAVLPRPGLSLQHCCDCKTLTILSPHNLNETDMTLHAFCQTVTCKSMCEAFTDKPIGGQSKLLTSPEFRGQLLTIAMDGTNI